MNSKVENKFLNDIDMTKKTPPMSYYPFSENDDKHTIIQYVLRTIISFLIDKKTRNKLDPLDINVFGTDAILEKIHPLWDVLSIDHQNTLKKKVQEIITELMGTHKELSERFESIKQNYSPKTIAKLIDICEKIVKDEASRKRIGDFV